MLTVMARYCWNALTRPMPKWLEVSLAVVTVIAFMTFVFAFLFAVYRPVFYVLCSVLLLMVAYVVANTKISSGASPGAGPTTGDDGDGGSSGVLARVAPGPPSRGGKI